MGKRASPGYRVRHDAREQYNRRALGKGEPENTRQYSDTLGEVYRNEGLFPAIKYELNSLLGYIFGKRGESPEEARISKEEYILRQRKNKHLEDVSLAAMVVGIIGGLFFISPNITG